MITLLYTIGIRIYAGLIRLASLWNTKARQWVKGRRMIWSQLSAFRQQTSETDPVIWIHCASLGEFEQGRPLIEKIRERYPHIRLVLTFFSPSGYEIRKHYAQVDLVCYLPLDTPANAHRFISQLQPDLVIFVKYEFWRHFLQQLNRSGIPPLLISAIFRPSQVFFRTYGGWYRRLLFLFRHIFVQDRSSANLLQQIGVTNYSIAGDTRVDRVLALQQEASTFPEIAAFTGDAPVWIAGSTWPEDEALLFPFWESVLPEHWKIIIAPHDIGESHLLQIEKQCPLPLVRYSQLSPRSSARVLLIDNIGMLSGLYRYGRIAYIGGGFGKAIHNLLEPIAFRLPVIFGPRHDKFQEALVLKATGGGFAIENEAGLRAVFDQLQEAPAYRQASAQAYDYLQQSRGSTGRILEFIETQFPGLIKREK